MPKRDGGVGCLLTNCYRNSMCFSFLGDGMVIVTNQAVHALYTYKLLIPDLIFGGGYVMGDLCSCSYT